MIMIIYKILYMELENMNIFLSVLQLLTSLPCNRSKHNFRWVIQESYMRRREPNVASDDLPASGSRSCSLTCQFRQVILGFILLSAPSGKALSWTLPYAFMLPLSLLHVPPAVVFIDVFWIESLMLHGQTKANGPVIPMSSWSFLFWVDMK